MPEYLDFLETEERCDSNQSRAKFGTDVFGIEAMHRIYEEWKQASDQSLIPLDTWFSSVPLAYRPGVLRLIDDVLSDRHVRMNTTDINVMRFIEDFNKEINTHLAPIHEDDAFR